MSLGENEIVTCYVFGKGKIVKKEITKNNFEIMVKPKVFEPHRTRNDLSVFQISDLKSSLDDRSIWFIGKIVEQERTANGNSSEVRGRADIEVSHILNLNLDVILEPHLPRHSNIKNYPPSLEESSACLQIQQKLADKAEGFLSNEVSPDISHMLDENVAVKSEFFP